ncbi:hypothetical protein AHAS_Ahas11G0036700 [Arachis hypogaea]
MLMLWMIAQSNPCVMWMSDRSLLSSVDELGKKVRSAIRIKNTPINPIFKRLHLKAVSCVHLGLSLHWLRVS